MASNVLLWKLISIYNGLSKLKQLFMMHMYICNWKKEHFYEILIQYEI